MSKKITHTFMVDVEKWMYREPLSGPELKDAEYYFSDLSGESTNFQNVIFSSMGFFLESLGVDPDGMDDLSYADSQTLYNIGMPDSLASLMLNSDLDIIIPISNANEKSISALAHADMTGRRNLIEIWWKQHGVRILFSDEKRAKSVMKADTIVPDSLQEVLASSDNLLIASVRSSKRNNWAGVYLFAINDLITEGNPPIYTRISEFEIGDYPFRVPSSIHKVIDSLATLLLIDGFEVSYVGYIMDKEEHQVNEIVNFDIDDEERPRFGVADKSEMHTFLYEESVAHFEGITNV